MGIVKKASRKGVIAFLRGRAKISAMAISSHTATSGCSIVSVAPPPNLMCPGSTNYSSRATPPKQRYLYQVQMKKNPYHQLRRPNRSETAMINQRSSLKSLNWCCQGCVRGCSFLRP